MNNIEKKEYKKLRARVKAGHHLPKAERVRYRLLREEYKKYKKEKAFNAQLATISNGIKQVEADARHNNGKGKADLEIIDIEKLTRQVADSGLDLNIFEDEMMDLPTAANIVDWTVNPKFMNYTAFAWQLKVMTELMAEWCTECTDRKWMSEIGPPGSTKFLPIDATVSQFKERVQLYEFGICPKCGGKRNRQHESLPYEQVACIGQRSGKSIEVGIISNYITHRYLMMRNPHKSFGVPPGKAIFITFCAYEKSQALETLWDDYTSQYNQAPWYKVYNQYLIDKSNKQGIDPKLMFRSMDTYIWYGNKMLTACCASSDKKALRGRTRVLAAIDEFGWMGAGDAVKANGKETRESLVKSLRTIRSGSDRLFADDPNIITALMLNASSPSSAFDPIMTLLKTADRDKRIITFHSSTWDANPTISRKSLSGEESTNFIEFMRDYGATPPLTDNPYFESERLVDKCIVPTLSPAIKYKTKITTDAIGGKYIGMELTDLLPSNYPHVITCDAGESNNSFAVGIYHLEKGDENISDYLVTDGLIELAPERVIETGEVYRVHFPSVFDAIIQICEKMHVKMVLYDRWNSIGELQRLREKKIQAEPYTATNTDFANLRSRVYSGGLKIPKMEKGSVNELDIGNPIDVRMSPITHFVLQIKTVRASGKKVIKPIAGEDDMFRTLVLANAYIEENRKVFLTEMSSDRNMRIGLGRTIGVLHRYSSGQASGGGNVVNKLGVVKLGRSR